MADDTPKPKKTIKLPPKAEEPAATSTAKSETIEQKIARLENEAKLAKLEAEAANRARPPVATRAKEAIKTGVKVTGGGIAKGAKWTGNKLLGAGQVRNPITGRLESTPNFLEKGIQGLADITEALSETARRNLSSRTTDERIADRMTPEQKSKMLADKAEAETRFKKTLKVQTVTGPKQQVSNDQARARAVLLNPPNGQQVITTGRGFSGVVPANASKVAITQPLDGRIARYKIRLENYIKNESPIYTSGDAPSVKAATLAASKAKVAKMVGSPFAEDFLIAGLNRSGMFTADEVTLVASQLKNTIEIKKLLTDSELFEAIDRPKTMLSGGAPKPLDGGASKFTTIQDDFGNEVRVTPEGRTTWAGQPPEPTLDERLAKFKGKKADTLKAAELAREVEAEAARRAVAPYGDTNEFGQARQAYEAAQARAERKVVLDALVAEKQAAGLEELKRADLAKAATRARIEGANNTTEQNFLKRLEAERQAATAQRLAEADATWDLRTPEELVPKAEAGAYGNTPNGTTREDRLRSIAALNALIPENIVPSGVTRMDRLRNIASANQASPERYALDRWLYSRAALNQVPTTGLPPRGTVLSTPRSGLPLGNTLSRGSMAFGMIPDVMMGHRAGTAGSGLSSQGDFLYPHEMQTLDGQTYSTDSLDYSTMMHPENADKYPQVTHSQRYSFYPQWYKGGELEAKALDVQNWVKQTGFEAKPMMGSQPISPELLNAFRYAQ